ncbi:MAG: hypothetical protein K9W46_00605 [Candidatus Heimdallarchaeum endolithica]|uniref:Uncharacterized protein n=1 Tax=Candidatus Heimdallarchaeum endolithica TaxID=2876572 RepID=A0A9Y1BST1_9ARCH|nr:MAG: hypothetical protein K9W46_00605 [Candidatus Heimdallarchaeum endolithica]
MREYHDSEKEELYKLMKAVQMSLNYILQKKDIYESSYIEELEKRNSAFISLLTYIQKTITEVVLRNSEFEKDLQVINQEYDLSQISKLDIIKETNLIAQSITRLLEYLIQIYLDNRLKNRVNITQENEALSSFPLFFENEMQIQSLTEVVLKIDTQLSRLIEEGFITKSRKRNINLDLANSISFTDKENFKPQKRPSLEDVLDEILIEG